MGAPSNRAAAFEAEDFPQMKFDPHRTTVEIDPASLPPARPEWHERIIDAIDAMKATRAITEQAARNMLNMLGIAERKREN